MQGVFTSGDYGYAAKSRMMGDRVQNRAVRVKSAAALSSKRSSTSQVGIRTSNRGQGGLAKLDSTS